MPAQAQLVANQDDLQIFHLAHFRISSVYQHQINNNVLAYCLLHLPCLRESFTFNLNASNQNILILERKGVSQMLLNSGHFYPSRSGKVDKSSVVLCIKSKSRTGFEGVVKTVFGSSNMKMVTPLDIYDWRASIGRTSYHPCPSFSPKAHQVGACGGSGHPTPHWSISLSQLVTGTMDRSQKKGAFQNK